MKVLPKLNASLRTKNRINEHGNEMTIVDGPKRTLCFKVPAILLVATDGWSGWFPFEEIDIHAE